MLARVFVIGETQGKTPVTSARPNQTRPDGGEKKRKKVWSSEPLQLDEVGREATLPVAQARTRPSCHSPAVPPGPRKL